MPHIIVKMLTGRSEKQKQQLAEEMTKVVMKVTGNGEESVSVSIEEVEHKDWTKKVYNTDIKNNWDKLYKKAWLQASVIIFITQPISMVYLNRPAVLCFDAARI